MDIVISMQQEWQLESMFSSMEFEEELNQLGWESSIRLGKSFKIKICVQSSTWSQELKEKEL